MVVMHKVGNNVVGLGENLTIMTFCGPVLLKIIWPMANGEESCLGGKRLYKHAKGVRTKKILPSQFTTNVLTPPLPLCY